MIRFLLVFAMATLLLSGCASTPDRGLAVQDTVRNASYADNVLFRDLVSGRGGVGFADHVLFPEVQRRELVRIEVLVPYAGDGISGMERWFIQHDGEGTVSYLVTLTPDGRGGTHFAVRLGDSDRSN